MPRIGATPPVIQEDEGGFTPTTLTTRVKGVARLMELLELVPASWLGPASTVNQEEDNQTQSVTPKECTSFKQMIAAWEKAMHWTQGLDCALSVMLAAVTSTMSVGDQLWVKIIGPASCGKTKLCEALATATKYVISKSTIRGFHSGYTDGKVKKGEKRKDYSLLSKLPGMTLLTKDGDTLIQAPNREQILSEARDVYDTVSRSDYRQGAGKDYMGIRCTWILCGTESLRTIDSSELGERFIDCVIMNNIDDDLEDMILATVAIKAEQNMGVEADGKPESHYDPEYVEAMALTGGYVNYLREHAAELLPKVRMPEWALHKCTRFGKFVSHMRARPSRHQDEIAGREFAARLVSQHIRLAKSLAVVMNKEVVDKSVLARVRRVALDTSRGQTLDMVHVLYDVGAEGMHPKSIALRTNRSEYDVRRMMKFLQRLEVVEPHEEETAPGIRGRVVWRLTQRMIRLYEEVT